MPQFLRSVGLLSLLIPTLLFAQQQSLSDSTFDQAFQLPGKFFKRIDRKIHGLDVQLSKQTDGYLDRLAKKEKKLHRKLQQSDSSVLNSTFDYAQAKYAQLRQQLKNPPAVNAFKGVYQANADSLNNLLSFLSTHPAILENSGALKDKLKLSNEKLQQLQGRIQVAEEAKAYIKKRQEELKLQLGRYSNLPKGLLKEFNDYKKQYYYYSQQVKEYREMLNDPDKMASHALALLSKLPAFQQFMRDHSPLGGLFSLPGNYASNANLNGLQTISQVQQTIQSRLPGLNAPTTTPVIPAVIQQSLQTVQHDPAVLKEKVKQLVGGKEDELDMPGFKPNDQKTKTFWRRLEYTTNLQNTRAGNFFPTTTDLGLSVGYKLTGKSVIGIGASYKMGWGKDIRHINITHEGMGVRSFLDMKLKGSFYASGGFEYNYQPVLLPSNATGGGSIDPATAGWTQSGLVGISKIVSIKSKFFKKTKLQLLWDFLSYQQVPQTQPLKFRIGYSWH